MSKEQPKTVYKKKTRSKLEGKVWIVLTCAGEGEEENEVILTK